MTTKLIEPIIKAHDAAVAESKNPLKGFNTVIYTDGGCKYDLGSWGIHGYTFTDDPTKSNSSVPNAVAGRKGYDLTRKEEKVNVISFFNACGVEEKSTNNRCELLAMSNALDLINNVPFDNVTILSDSLYVLEGMTKHLDKWSKNNWTKSTGESIVNKDLWVNVNTQYSEATSKYGRNLAFIKVKGHSGDVGNDCADKNATLGRVLYENGKDPEWHICNDPKAEWTAEFSINPLISDNYFVYQTGASNTVDNKNIYMQATVNKSSSKGGDDKIETLGKRIADTVLSLVVTPEPVTQLEHLKNFLNGKLPPYSIVVSSLNALRLDRIAKDMLTHEAFDLRLKHDGVTVITSANQEVCKVLNPVRLGYRFLNHYGGMYNILVNEMYKDTTVFTEHDITDTMYTSTTVKSKTTTKVTLESDLITVNTDIDGKTVPIPLTIGVDMPRKLTLSKLKDHNPRVCLYTRRSSEHSLTYFTIVFSDVGIGIWSAIYANERFF